ncbi:MAG: hypothetical protein J6B48_05975 [Clostridia bacterium]|nr:hypothetical protein [Clostridia bacterium]
MRKNTLIKLLAVLAMCFLIGAALVSCGEEAEDETAKTIVGVEFVGDDLVITYDDGTKTTTAIPAAAECTHENAKAYSLVDHGVRDVNDEGYDPANPESRFVNGVILNVCNDCRGAWTTEGVLHVGYTVDGTEATCTTLATTYTICDIPGCGAHFNINTEAGELKDHVLSTEIVGDYCEGGKKVTTCANCNYLEEVEIPKAADDGFDGIHNVAAGTWEVVTPATATTKGVVKGVCTVDLCGKTVTKEIGVLPDKADNDEYDFDEENSDMFVACGDSANYIYTHKATGLKFNVTKAGEEVIKHELNGKLMTSVEQVPAGKEFESAYYLEDYKGIITFANHPVSCDKAALAHFICTAEHDNGTVCGKDISVYVKLKHTTVDANWVTVPGQEPACKVPVKQTQDCTVCGTTVDKELPLQDHNYEYKSDILYTKNGDSYVAGYTFPEKANAASDIPALYYQGVCKYCQGLEYTALTEYDYNFKVEAAATCQGNGSAVITYKKASDGTTATVTVVLPKFAHKTTVNGEKVDIVEGKENIKVVIYNADHADYKNLVKELDNVAFSATSPVLGYIHCDCDCEGCVSHDVTVWVQKLGADQPATKAFN